MTRDELRRRALTALDDSATTPRFWSLAEVDHLIDECQEYLAEETEALTRTVYVPERAGTMFYSLRGLGYDVLAPWRLWTRNRQHRLWPITLTELDGHYERWLTVTGQPEWWFLLSWDVLGVWPVPTTGGGVLEVDCLVWPKALLSDTDLPESPDPDHDLLLDCVVVEGQIKQWDVARALEIALPLSARYRDSRARNGLRRVQERFFTRDIGDLRA